MFIYFLNKIRLSYDEQASKLRIVFDANKKINYVINKGSTECRVPITIVPGNLTDEQIDALV